MTDYPKNFFAKRDYVYCLRWFLLKTHHYRRSIKSCYWFDQIIWKFACISRDLLIADRFGKRKPFCPGMYKNLVPLYHYSSVPNKRTGPNKRTRWNFDKNQISVQGGILIKILEYRVKTGTFINNKKDIWKYTYLFPKSPK